MWPSSLPALGFGTSNILHYRDTRSALKGLDNAYEAGIRYFDTAPRYGFGWAEKILGQFASGKRKDITIATKAGLEPGRIKSHIPFKILSTLRSQAKAWSSKSTLHASPQVIMPSPATLSADRLRDSLERSLRQLRTDYVDILLLHEATVSYAHQEEVLRFVSDAIATGKTKAVGIGSTPSALIDAEHLNPVYQVLQTDFEWTPSWHKGPAISLTNSYGLFHAAKDLMNKASDAEFRNRMVNITGMDLHRRQDTLRLVLSAAAILNTGGITLFSSTHDEHIREITNCWERHRLPEIMMMEAISFIRTHLR